MRASWRWYSKKVIKMLRVSSRVALSVGILSVVSCSSPLIVAPLPPTTAAFGLVAPTTGTSLKVTVQDRRRDSEYHGTGFILASPIFGKGLSEMEVGGGGLLTPNYFGYASGDRDAVSKVFQAAAKESLDVMGMSREEGLTLELVIQDFRIDFHQVKGTTGPNKPGPATPMNCVGYGLVEAVLRTADGGELHRRAFRLTYYETNPPSFTASGLELMQACASRVYTLAAWESSVATLREHHGWKADPGRLQAQLGRLDGEKDPIARRKLVFWLGLTGQESEPVKERLLSLFRSEKDQAVRQAAAVSLGMLGAREIGGEVEGILSGSKPNPAWDNSDTEQVWYLLRTVSLLGTSELEAKIPKTKLFRRRNLENLARFQQTGTIPPPSETAARVTDKMKQGRSRP
ncbi:MAG: HEAT repeat domain-containing protein [Thermoanaerobaculia bacterium]